MHNSKCDSECCYLEIMVIMTCREHSLNSEAQWTPGLDHLNTNLSRDHQKKHLTPTKTKKNTKYKKKKNGWFKQGWQYNKCLYNLKQKYLWHRRFHGEALPSMEPFHAQKVIYSRKWLFRWFGFYLCLYGFVLSSVMLIRVVYRRAPWSKTNFHIGDIKVYWIELK